MVRIMTKTLDWFGVRLTVTYTWSDSKGAEITDIRSDENLFDLFSLPYIGRIEAKLTEMELTHE